MKLKCVIFVLTLVISATLNAQFQISIDAEILDNQSKKPIPFTEIDFPNSPVKVITDIKGRFYCYYDENVLLPETKVHFTAKGYQTEETTVRQLYRLLANSSKIYLKPKGIHHQLLLVEDVNLTEQVSGVVMHNKEPLPGAVINKKGTFLETKTDDQGRYVINAETDDVLLANFVGMKPRQLVVKENKSLNILLDSDGTQLGEIILEGQSEKELQIDLGQNTRKSFDAIGTAVNVFTQKDIKDHHTSLIDVLAGKFAGIPAGTGAPGVTPVFSMRSTNSISYPANVIYDIDGQIFDTNASLGMRLPFVDVQNIHSISVLRSLAATNKYGTLGRGGVIVIRTKMMEADPSSDSIETAVVKGNDYNETLRPFSKLNIVTNYKQELLDSKSIEMAKKIYKDRKNQKKQGLGFFIESAAYFSSTDYSFALDILESLESKIGDNIKALRTLAFKYEVLSEFKKAQNIYQKIAISQPKSIQSYYDLARVYEINGYYQQSFEIYKNMLANSIEGVDAKPLLRVVSNEFRRFLLKHRGEVDYTDIPSVFLSAKFKLDTRIVLEYNDPYAEFSVQFVNPQKKFFKWNHTQFENKQRMLDEIRKGYSIEEYTIEHSVPGDWLVNLKAVNTKSIKNPEYLKYTIYKNYGTLNETKTIKLINLNTLNEKVRLETIR